jgi:HK97 family phage portal protein
MKLFGFNITREKAIVPSLSSVDGRGGWFSIFRESFPGAWQQNTEVELANVLTYSPVYACISLISRDISKLRLRLMEQDEDEIWIETANPAFSPVLRRPNHYQTRIEFIQNWMITKLIHGNTYVLKQRDNRGVVVAMYVLEPTRVTPMVSGSGDVYYSLQQDALSGVGQHSTVVPASEIIHDRMNPWYHPLVGISPISACGLAAVQALRIMDNSSVFFGNGSNPSGVLTATGAISDETAQRLKDHWTTAFSGANAGQVAVLGDGLKFEQMSMSAVDAQLIEQLNWTALEVCRAFNMPPYKVAVGPMPTYNNIEALNQEYYAQTLQHHIESIEDGLDKGLGLSEGRINGHQYGVEFDLDGLLRMDSATRLKAALDALSSGMSPNEVRRKYHDLGPAKGGDSPMVQQQYYSLEALAERDSDKPFAQPDPSTPPPAQIAEAAEPEEDEDDTEERAIEWLRIKAAAAGLGQAA